MATRTLTRSRQALVASAAVACLAAAGCSGSVEAGEGTATVSPAGSAASPSKSAPPPCTNPEGGLCLGPLEVDTDYTTVVMEPTLTYSVPVDGWANYEDTPGNFLLVPPGNDLPGVNAGTSDFIGVYTSVAATRFNALPDCDHVERVPGVDNTPADIAAWMRRQPVLRVTRPVAVSVGGLDGLMVDARARAGGKLPTCHVGKDTFTVFLLFSGLAPSSLDHGVIDDMTMRLYLLSYQGGTLAIELDDIDAAPATLASLSDVVEGITFHVP